MQIIKPIWLTHGGMRPNPDPSLCASYIFTIGFPDYLKDHTDLDYPEQAKRRTSKSTAATSPPTDPAWSPQQEVYNP
jgi:hypothetical protein